MNKNELQNAISFFENKIVQQGTITNARDEEHLKQLKQLLKEIDQ